VIGICYRGILVFVLKFTIYIYIYICMYYRSQGERSHNSYKRNVHFHHKWNHTEVKQMKTKVYRINLQKNYEDTCYTCGMKRHWTRTSRTPKHLVDLYLASIKEKEK